MSRTFFRSISLIFFIFLQPFAIADSTPPLIGAVSSIENHVVHFRTALEDLDLEYESLSRTDRNRVMSPTSKTHIFSVTPHKILKRVSVPDGIRPDCSELPVTIDDLEAIVTSDQTQSMLDFLNTIPQGAMQTYTFVTHSLSLQRGLLTQGSHVISAMSPGVVRTTMDGKISLRFVCDPKNPNYGTVETIYFDEPSQSLHTKEWRFTDQNGHPIAANQRVHNSPGSCVICHSSRYNGDGAQDTRLLNHFIKFNWLSYNRWGDCKRERGITFYGSADDSVGSFITPPKTDRAEDCTDDQDQKAHTDEVADFKKFKNEFYDNNPCYLTLPRPKNNFDYPYIGDEAYSGGYLGLYTRSPNLRTTDAFSLLTAKRNLALLKKPDPFLTEKMGRDVSLYELVKPYLVMSEIGCFSTQEKDQELMSLGVLTRDLLETPSSRLFLNEKRNSDRLKKYPNEYIQSLLARSLDFVGADWSLEFRKYYPTFNAGNLISIMNVTTAFMVKELAAENAAIQDAATPFTDNPIKRFAGQTAPGRDYSCIDQGIGTLGGTAYKEVIQKMEPYRAPLCNALREEYKKRIAKNRAFISEVIKIRKNELETAAAKIVLPSSADSRSLTSIEHGQALVQKGARGHCVECHAMNSPGEVPLELRFMPDPESPFEVNQDILPLLKTNAFIRDLDFDLRSRRMPSDTHPIFEDQEISDIEDYLHSLGTK